jgi:predicted nucleic acid-binding protein
MASIRLDIRWQTSSGGEVPDGGGSRGAQGNCGPEAIQELDEEARGESSRSRVTVSDLVIFDTSIFIDHLRTGCHQQRIESVTGLIRTSSVVLAELWRGATKPAKQEFAGAGEESSPPDPHGKELAGVGPDIGEDWRGSKLHTGQAARPAFHVLLALTAWSPGARLITSNRSAFEMISGYRRLQLEIW